MNTQGPPTLIQTSLRVRYSLTRWDILFCRLWVSAHHRTLTPIILLMCVGVPLLTYRHPENIRFPLGYFIFNIFFSTVVMVCFMAVIQIGIKTLLVFISKNREVIG